MLSFNGGHLRLRVALWLGFSVPLRGLLWVGAIGLTVVACKIIPRRGGARMWRVLIVNSISHARACRDLSESAGLQELCFSVSLFLSFTFRHSLTASSSPGGSLYPALSTHYGVSFAPETFASLRGDICLCPPSTEVLGSDCALARGLAVRYY